MSTFILFVTLGILTLLENSQGLEDCKPILTEMKQRQKAGFELCEKSLNVKDAADKEAKMTCIVKCYLTAQGILNAQGQVDKDMIKQYLSDKIPPIMLAQIGPKAAELIGGCITKHTPQLDPADATCKSYDPLFKCFMASIMEMCPV